MGLLTPRIVPYDPEGYDSGGALPRGANPASVKPKPAAAPQRGLLSRIGSYLTPDRLQVIGSGLQDLGRGTNSLDDVLQQLHEQQMQRVAAVWQDEQRMRQRAQWKQQDQQLVAQAAAAESAPEAVRPLARADPGGYAGAALTEALRPHPSLLAQGDPRLAPFRHGTVVQDDGRGSLSTLQAPREPAANINVGAMSQRATDAQVEWAVAHGGQMPPNLRDKRAQAQFWDAYAARMETDGNTAGQQVARRAQNAANQQALANLTTRMRNMGAAEEAASREFALVGRLNEQYARSNSPMVNETLGAFQRRAQGNPERMALMTAMTSAAGEYAQILNAGAPPTEGSRHEAREFLDPNATVGEILAVLATAQEGMRYKTESMQAQREQILRELSDSPGGGSPSPPTPAPVNTPPPRRIRLNP